jgi:hypothetical protein
LESKKLADLKAIALQFNASAADKRSKQSWVDAILAAQPTAIKPLEEVKPAATCADCPKFRPHTDGTDKGWCCLFDRFAREHHAMTQDCINTIEVEQDDYLFHEAIVVEESQEMQPVNLPRVGETHFIGDRLLRCIEIGGEYAAVWDVIKDGLKVGEICMDWMCFWHHTFSFELFATPQEAIASLCESVAELVEKPEFEICPTNTESLFTVMSHKSGKHYQVSLDSNSCTCPHWNNRHTQAGFRDKHIDAVKIFSQSHSREQLCHQLS